MIHEYAMNRGLFIASTTIRRFCAARLSSLVRYTSIYNVETVTDLADVVNTSSKTNRAVLFQDSRGEQNWVWYDWKSFLKRFYKPLKGISRQRIFRVSTTDKTSVFVKESTDGNEVKVTLLKTVPPLDSYPEMIVPPGLTDTRIEYLRRLISNENKDYMAPQTQEE